MKKNIKKIILIINVILIILAIIFLGLSIFLNDENNTFLILALSNIIIVNILNIIINKKRI